MEAADVTICLMAYCAHLGVSLSDLIERKMRVNWQRTHNGEWVQDDQGLAPRRGKRDIA
jgi:hypothetical protein